MLSNKTYVLLKQGTLVTTNELDEENFVPIAYEDYLGKLDWLDSDMEIIKNYLNKKTTVYIMNEDEIIIGYETLDSLKLKIAHQKFSISQFL